MCEFLSEHSDWYDTDEDQRPTRTRSEDRYTPESSIHALMEYIDDLWEGVKERLGHFDREGPTAWSEAPAEECSPYLDTFVNTNPALNFQTSQNFVA